MTNVEVRGSDSPSRRVELEQRPVGEFFNIPDLAKRLSPITEKNPILDAMVEALRSGGLEGGEIQARLVQFFTNTAGLSERNEILDPFESILFVIPRLPLNEIAFTGKAHEKLEKLKSLIESNPKAEGATLELIDADVNFTEHSVRGGKILTAEKTGRIRRIVFSPDPSHARATEQLYRGEFKRNPAIHIRAVEINPDTAYI